MQFVKFIALGFFASLGMASIEVAKKAEVADCSCSTTPTVTVTATPSVGIVPSGTVTVTVTLSSATAENGGSSPPYGVVPSESATGGLLTETSATPVPPTVTESTGTMTTAPPGGDETSWPHSETGVTASTETIPATGDETGTVTGTDQTTATDTATATDTGIESITGSDTQSPTETPTDSTGSATPSAPAATTSAHSGAASIAVHVGALFGGAAALFMIQYI
ncbi:hypothetical protein GGS20DRAFT_591349 [Poronia punctata]|nr:hypothetical protein GGS20DRAFT_591349 [Poronia punctata]